MVARAQWTFQVLQGSVETLFRWGGKRLHHFIANLFRKPCIKFHANRPSFVWDITKNILVSFFPDTLYIHTHIKHKEYLYSALRNEKLLCVAIEHALTHCQQNESCDRGLTSGHNFRAQILLQNVSVWGYYSSIYRLICQCLLLYMLLSVMSLISHHRMCWFEKESDTRVWKSSAVAEMATHCSK